ncbi:hypothetical protein C5167_006117 [Papaver somniferum]|uniref:Uncharacterized protein n=1 Tax=Papaver somniferum TaxID=3469 RepID=A0A4Y7JDD2_PAPSO|nr:hypothetical protein C5167_006117 [Papaver somniferum]
MRKVSYAINFNSFGLPIEVHIEEYMSEFDTLQIMLDLGLAELSPLEMPMTGLMTGDIPKLMPGVVNKS